MQFGFCRNDLDKEPKGVTGLYLRNYPEYDHKKGDLYWVLDRKEAIELIWQLMKDIIRGPKF